MVEPYGIFHHPNDSPKDGTIHEIAQRQLKQWQAIAMKWPLYADPNRDGREAVICTSCNQVLWFLTDMGGHSFIYTDSELSALLVAHIRQRHEEAAPCN